MELRSGQTLQNGKYTIERELGRGRFGITYLAKKVDGNRWVIKILNPQVLASLDEPDRDRLKTQFRQEAVKLAKCSGTPHIVQAAMPFEESELVGLPLEYVEGSNLGERGQRILSESRALSYIRQIGRALEVVHGQNLIHRDIRPANILLRIADNQVEAVLTEFGLAMDSATALTRTRKHELMDGFSPIELYSRDQPLGPYTDVYSLAATLYELLTGAVPPSAEDRQIQGTPLPLPQTQNPNISSQTAQAILTGLELQPQKRPQSVAAWLAMLPTPSQVTGNQSISPVDTPEPQPSFTPASSGSPIKRPQTLPNWDKWQAIWAAAAVAVVLLTFIFSTWLNSRPSNPPSPPASSPAVQPSTP
jgi:serine/threonine protein kinase